MKLGTVEAINVRRGPGDEQFRMKYYGVRKRHEHGLVKLKNSGRTTIVASTYVTRVRNDESSGQGSDDLRETFGKRVTDAATRTEFEFHVAIASILDTRNRVYGDSSVVEVSKVF